MVVKTTTTTGKEESNAVPDLLRRANFKMSSPPKNIIFNFDDKVNVHTGAFYSVR